MDQNSSDLQSKETAAPSSRQNEMQDSLKVTLSLLDATQGQKTNTQTPLPIIHIRKLSNVEPSTSTPMPRRVSIQEPPASVFLPRRGSEQMLDTASHRLEAVARSQEDQQAP
uniref:Predicted gene, 36864 n=1 Tax=Mus musculus TaxID=10090 RepID=A0A1Y7VM92_MOUSE